MTDLDDHDETQCQGLHVEMHYTIRCYGMSAGALAFETWFNTVFIKQNPAAAKSFDFSRTEHEGVPFIEVMQHDLFFTVDALQCLFEASRTQESEIKNVEVFNPDLN